MLYFGGHVQWASFVALNVGSFMVFESANFFGYIVSCIEGLVSLLCKSQFFACLIATLPSFAQAVFLRKISFSTYLFNI